MPALLKCLQVQERHSQRSNEHQAKAKHILQTGVPLTALRYIKYPKEVNFASASHQELLLMQDKKLLCNGNANQKETGQKLTQNTVMTKPSNGKLQFSTYLICF